MNATLDQTLGDLIAELPALAAEHARSTETYQTLDRAARAVAQLQTLGVNAFAQKLGWGRVSRLDEMPTDYKDGSLLITRQPAMSWR